MSKKRVLCLYIVMMSLLIHLSCQAAESKNIVIFGAGYVGLVTGSCLATYGHNITFIETNPDKVAFLQKKMIPIFEPQLDQLYSLGVENGLIRLRGTLDHEIDDADIVIIAVPTPTNEAGEPQVQAVKEVLLQIAASLGNRKNQLIISIRSTLLPDSFRELQMFCSTQSILLSLVMNPEFLRESTAIKDFFHPPFCVAGGSDPEAVQSILSLYKEISPNRYAVSGESACMIKYACNAFHALKIAFTNEISSTCESLAIDPQEVMGVFCQDRHLNISKAYLRPGFAFGGSCLTKDLRALLTLNQTFGTSSPLLSAILPSNQCRFQRALEAILKGNHRRLAVLGISFKKSSDDIRESPYLKLIDSLYREGVSMKIYDPDIDFEKLKKTNFELFEQHLLYLVPFIRNDLDSTLEECDGVVLCKDLLNAEWLKIIVDRGVPIYDLEYYAAQNLRAERESR